jgi:hypothetical protein
LPEFASNTSFLAQTRSVWFARQRPSPAFFGRFVRALRGVHFYRWNALPFAPRRSRHHPSVSDGHVGVRARVRTGRHPWLRPGALLATEQRFKRVFPDVKSIKLIGMWGTAPPSIWPNPSLCSGRDRERIALRVRIDRTRPPLRPKCQTACC